MADEGVHNHIEQLVAEEHELWQREQAGQATDEDVQATRRGQGRARPVLGPAPAAARAP